MSDYLLALTVGPVQEFIAAARRTRDLWFGSYLLSEISKATAKAVCDQGGTLIFPAPQSDADLKMDSPLNVANVILAELRSGDPKAVACSAKAAARARFRVFADSVFHEHRNRIDPGRWNEQVDDVIEFYAAWHITTSQTYRSDRAAVMRLLAARKMCRDFLPAKGRAGIPKSSLDGQRESVLTKQVPERSRRPLRLRSGEQLDVVGIVKRAWSPAAGTPRYPSVSRVAADPWLRGIGAARLAPLIQACRGLGTEVLHELDTSDGRGHPHYAAFPFEGTALFRSRHCDLREEAELSEAELAPLARALTELVRDFREPDPYLGILVADGDHMGRALSRLACAEDHRAFSRSLARFAREARRLVHAHHGVLVYAGGDDVLAFIPVDQCLACARALRDEFGTVVGDWSVKTNAQLSFSVGVAIAHFMEPLEDLLGYGRTAEQHAKSPQPEDRGQVDRNGLAIHVVKRGSGPIMARANWSTDPEKHLQELARWLASGGVPVTVAYDMHEVAKVYEAWPAESVADAIQRDVLAVMKGKQPRGSSRMADVEALIRARVSDADSLRGVANEFLVAREIAAALGQASSSVSEGRASL